MPQKQSVALVQTDDRNINQLQQYFKKVLNPISNNPVIQGLILSKVSLKSGSNTINHTLNRNLVGWFLVRQRGAGSVYDLQDTNTSPSVTLVLNASQAVVVDIYVF